MKSYSEIHLRLFHCVFLQKPSFFSFGCQDIPRLRKLRLAENRISHMRCQTSWVFATSAPSLKFASHPNTQTKMCEYRCKCMSRVFLSYCGHDVFSFCESWDEHFAGKLINWQASLSSASSTCIQIPCRDLSYFPWSVTRSGHHALRSMCPCDCRSQLPQYRAQVLHRLPRLRQLDSQQAPSTHVFLPSYAKHEKIWKFFRDHWKFFTSQLGSSDAGHSWGAGEDRSDLRWSLGFGWMDGWMGADWRWK